MGLAPWLAAEIPLLVDRGVVSHPELKGIMSSPSSSSSSSSSYDEDEGGKGEVEGSGDGIELAE